MIRAIVVSLAVVVLVAGCDIPTGITVRGPCRAVVRWFSHRDSLTGASVVDSIVTVTEAASCPS